jgi:hypothetical protein
VPRVVATIISLDPWGLAAIQTVDSALYEVVLALDGGSVARWHVSTTSASACRGRPSTVGRPPDTGWRIGGQAMHHDGPLAIAPRRAVADARLPPPAIREQGNAAGGEEEAR